MPKLLMIYDGERKEKIKNFIKEHTKTNDLGFHYMTQEDKDELEKLQWDLSDVWVYTDDEHFDAIHNKEELQEIKKTE